QRDPGGRRRLQGRRGAREDQGALRPYPARAGSSAGAGRRAAPEWRAPGHRQEAGPAARRSHGLAPPPPEVRRRGSAGAAVHRDLGRTGVAPLPSSRVRKAAGAGSWRRLSVLLVRSGPVLVLGDGDAGTDAGDAREGPARGDGTAQARARDRGGAHPRQEPDGGRVRLPAGLHPSPRFAARALRDRRRLQARRHVHRAHPRRDGSRYPTRRPNLVPHRQEKRRHPAAPAVKRGRWRVVAFAALAVIGAGAVACLAQGIHGDTGALDVTGTIEARQVDVSAKITGRIVELAVREGQPVTRGQLIARLDTETLAADVRRAEAALRTAEAQLAD